MNLQVILLGGLVILGGIIFMLPELGLVLCAIGVPLFKAAIQPYLGAVDLTAYLFVVTGVSIILHLIVRKQRITLPKLNFNILILSFTTMLLASILYTPLPRYGLEIFLRFVMVNLSLLYMVVMWVTDEKKARRLFSIFLWITLSYGVLIVLMLFLAPSLLPQSRAVLAGTSIEATGLNLAVGILVATTFMVTGMIRGKSKRLLLAIFGIFSIAALIATNSRGPLIAFVIGGVSLLFLLGRTRRWRRYAVIGVILTVGLVTLAFALLPSQYTGRYALLFDLKSSSVATRLELWQLVGNHLDDWFFTGAGLFGFAYYYTGRTADLSLFGPQPHNLFLDVFADIGIFGLMLFLILVGYLFLQAISWPHRQFTWLRSLLIANSAGFIAIVVESLFSTSLISTRLLWFFGGSILALRRIERKQDEEVWQADTGYGCTSVRSDPGEGR